MSELTKKEKEVLEYIIEFKRTNGFSPTQSEIAKACYTSRSYVRTVIDRLQDKGYVRVGTHKARTIVVKKFL